MPRTGREYVVVLDEGQWTPAPWTNVIANAQFGFQVSADGSGSTWSLNAQQNQITPWWNDPVTDAPAEAIYIRDEESGDLWSATPLPIREPSSTYIVRHGFGYSRFEHTSHGISLDLLQFVPLEDSIKISRLKIVNRSATARQLSVTHYLDWVLGNQRSRTAAFIVTEIEPKTRATAGAQSVERGLSLRESPSWTWRAGNKPAPPTARSSSAATDLWPNPRRCSARIDCRIVSGAASIPAVRCRR